MKDKYLFIATLIALVSSTIMFCLFATTSLLPTSLMHNAPSPVIFLFLGLVSGAEASLSFSVDNKTNVANVAEAPGEWPPLPPPPDDYQPTTRVNGRSLKRTIEETRKSHLEQLANMEKKLADAETTIKDLQVAANLAPDPPPPPPSPSPPAPAAPAAAADKTEKEGS